MTLVERAQAIVSGQAGSRVVPVAGERVARAPLHHGASGMTWRKRTEPRTPTMPRSGMEATIIYLTSHRSGKK